MISREDLKWVWAAYRKGALDSLSEYFTNDPEQFTEQWAQFLEHEIYVWIMAADTPRGRIPVGLAIGRPFIDDVVIVGNFTWFPWASKRNVYESVVNMVNELRKDVNMIFTVDQTAKELAVWVARHGIVRRVGTLHDMEDGPLAMFQSRRP